MPANLKPANIAHIPLFCDLPPAQLDKLLPLLKSKTFPADTNIITAGFGNDMIYIIQYGTVKIHVEQIDGSSIILDILGPDEIIGDMGFSEGYSDTMTVVTMEATSLFWLPQAIFQQCLRTMPQLSNNLVRTLSQRLRRAEEQIQTFAKLDVYGRLARRILTFAEEYGEVTQSGDIFIPLRLTQSDLADLIGASRVRVNQVLVTYKRHNYISVDQAHRITVHNPHALGKYCQQLLADQVGG